MNHLGTACKTLAGFEVRLVNQRYARCKRSVNPQIIMHTLSKILGWQGMHILKCILNMKFRTWCGIVTFSKGAVNTWEESGHPRCSTFLTSSSFGTDPLPYLEFKNESIDTWPTIIGYYNEKVGGQHCSRLLWPKWFSYTTHCYENSVRSQVRAIMPHGIEKT